MTEPGKALGYQKPRGDAILLTAREFPRHEG
jgi:hypothetical protein